MTVAPSAPKDTWSPSPATGALSSGLYDWCGFETAVCLAMRAEAEVVRVDITRRADVGTSGYEKTLTRPEPMRIGAWSFQRTSTSSGRRMPRIQMASLWSRCRTAAAKTCCRPSSARAPRQGEDLDPSTDADLGDGFLTSQGYTLVWVSWQFDVARAGGGVKLDAPVASGVSGVVRAQFTLNQRASERRWARTRTCQAGAWRSSGRSPVCLESRASILGPISSSS